MVVFYHCAQIFFRDFTQIREHFADFSLMLFVCFFFFIPTLNEYVHQRALVDELFVKILKYLILQKISISFINVNINTRLLKSFSFSQFLAFFLFFFPQTRFVDIYLCRERPKIMKIQNVIDSTHYCCIHFIFSKIVYIIFTSQNVTRVHTTLKRLCSLIFANQQN